MVYGVWFLVYGLWLRVHYLGFRGIVEARVREGGGLHSVSGSGCLEGWV